MNDLDLDLDDAESARLSDLMHRAADGLPPADPQVTIPTTRRHPGRWLAAAAAVAALVVGGVLVLRGGHGGRGDTGPANTVDPRLTTVIEQTGIWRLPEGLDDLRVVGAAEIGVGTPPVRYLVDDVAEPTRWVMLAAYGAPLPAADESQVVDLGGDVHLSISDPGPGDAPGPPGVFAMSIGESTPYLSGMFFGVDRDQLVELLTRSFADEATLTDPDRLNDALTAVEPIDGLIAPLWVPTTEASTAGVELTLLDDDREVVVHLQRTGLPPGVAALNSLLQLDQIQQLGTSPATSVRERADLGPHALELRWDDAASREGEVIVFSDDGTMITAIRAVPATEAAEAAPLSEAEQLRIIGSLRAMGESAFRTALTTSNVEFVAPVPRQAVPDITTTVVSGPSD